MTAESTTKTTNIGTPRKLPAIQYTCVYVALSTGSSHFQCYMLTTGGTRGQGYIWTCAAVHTLCDVKCITLQNKRKQWMRLVGLMYAHTGTC